MTKKAPKKRTLEDIAIREKLGRVKRRKVPYFMTRCPDCLIPLKVTDDEMADDKIAAHQMTRCRRAGMRWMNAENGRRG